MPTSAPTQQQWDQLEQALKNIVTQKSIDLGIPQDDWITYLATDVAEGVLIILERTGWGLRGGKED
jgi:hypothetical protein